jgi:hypothetical protein
MPGSLLLPLANHLRDSQPIVESRIKGGSMSPAIPSGARLRIQVRREARFQPGEIVYFQAEAGDFTVHRVVCEVRGWLLTRGDRCLAPDLPVPVSRIIGVVVGVERLGEWEAPRELRGERLLSPLARRVSATAALMALAIGVPIASPVVGGLQRCESLARRVFSSS